MPTVIQEKADELRAKRKALGEIFAGKPDYAFSAEEVSDIQRRNKELESLQAAFDALADAEEIATKNRAALETMQRPSNGIQHPGKAGQRLNASGLIIPESSLGEHFIASNEYKTWRPGQKQTVSVDLPGVAFKATFDTAGATLTSYDRPPGMVLVGVQRLTVADLLARGVTTANTIRYVQEDTYTNAATAVAETGTKPEASWDTSEVDAPVRKIAVTAKVTDELFADFPAMQSYIDARLRFMVAEREEALLLNGNGTPPNIRGILQTSGIQTQATGADPVPDAIYKAMIKVMSVGFFDPDGVIMHPLDWQDVRLLRTTDGIYIWGSPAEPGPNRIWGLPVDVTTAISQNTALVGAFRLGAQVFYREGLRVEMTNSNEDDFKKNLIAIRAEQREALAVYRPKAFCSVTGV